MKKKLGIFLAVCLLAAGGVICYWAWKMDQPKTGREADREFAYGSGISLGEITGIQEESLYKLCRVWGFVKYRHPSVLDGSINWDAELFRIMPEVLQANSGEEVNEILTAWLSRFPFEEENGANAEEVLKLQEEKGLIEPDLAWISDRDFLGEELCSYLEKLSRTIVTDRRESYAYLTEVGVNFENEQGRAVKPEDDGSKLLGLFRFWNSYAYYSPYLDLTKTDWNQALREGISDMVKAESKRDYILVLSALAAKTGDGHVALQDNRGGIYYFYGSYMLPINYQMIDGQVVVERVPEEGCELQPGDIIVAVDGMRMEDRIQEL